LGREVALEVAGKVGISPALMMEKVEESPSLWERMTAERTAYVVAMQVVLSERAMGGHLVYHGYAGHLLLKGMPALLKVRVIAPMEVRVPLVMEEWHLGAEAAEAHIKKMDDARARWTKFVFGVDWRDPSLYDVVLNLGVISVSTACEALAGMARSPEFALDEAILGKLRDFGLASRIRLALVTGTLPGASKLEVEVQDGIAFIKGDIPRDPRYADSEARFKKALTDMVLSVEGVKHLTLGVRALPSAAAD
jgi:cytidylate kinase